MNMSRLTKPKKSATFFAKMADLANSCDSKCRTCKFWVESRPFWLKRVVGRLHTRYMSRPAKPKKVSQFLAKMTDWANSCDPECKICTFYIESWPFWLEWVV